MVKYYNQNDYDYVPYPSPELPNATVKSGGCGVCCGAMIVSSMTSQTVDPESMAAYSVANGARVSGGTDMNTLAEAICRDYGLSCETTSDENKLLEHLKAGGMAIANVGGDRDGWTGVFSNGGHFVVAAEYNGYTVAIMDPAYYSSKFTLAGRSGKVTVHGDYCYCDISVLGADCANREPSYWLFKKGDGDMPEGATAAKITVNGKEYPAYILGGHTYFAQGVQVSEFVNSLNRTYAWNSTNLTLEIK